jgi:hypothetical protein
VDGEEEFQNIFKDVWWHYNPNLGATTYEQFFTLFEINKREGGYMGE